MNEPQVIVFGKGDKVVVNGTYGDEPCVFVSDAKQPGVVGESAEREGLSDDELGVNPIVIITGSEHRALLLHRLLTGGLDHITA